MTNEEIKNKIADFEKRAKNPNLPSSAIAALEKKISELKSQISEEPKAPSAPSGKRGRPKGSVKSAPKKKGKRGRPAKQEKAPAKPKAKYKTEPKSDGSVPDCDELLKRWRERRQKAKDMGKKRRTKPVFTKISEGVVSAVEKAIKNVPKADIKAQPVRTVKKFEVLRDAADQFLKAFKSVLGEDYVKTEAEKELADLEGLISSLQEKYIKKYGDGGMMNADGDDEDMPVIRTQFEEEDYEYARGGGVGEISFENSNLYLYGWGKDSNGNSIVKVGFPNQRAFSIQTNGVLNFTHDKRGYKVNELDSNEIAKIESEVVDYVKNYGSKDQKSKLKMYK
jgi:hypothetical protein